MSTTTDNPTRNGVDTAALFTTLDTRDGIATSDGTNDATPASAASVAPLGVRIDVNELSRRVRVRNRGELTLLDAVSFTLAAGELVAIVGPSGAGKTTLLEAIAGIAPATVGSVLFDGIDVHANLGTFRNVLGYVPQDDIIHADLPLQRMLRYAARLRLPSSTTGAEVDDAVRDAIDAVGLSGQVDVRVGSLSGGQRKRASIAVELLTDPHLFFLDEPTSGLDPVTAAELIARLRQLADRSATVVFTTHSVADLASCDRVVFMTPGGRVGFVGTVNEALDHYAVGSVPELYRRLADPEATTYTAGTSATAAAPHAGPRRVNRRPAAGGLTQWRVLTRRTLETLVRNRVTLAILVGSPALVVGMFAILFRPGAFDFQNPDPSSMVMIGFWVVFAAFFFGLTYGLLQICTERTILRRERLVGLRLGAYVASKVTVLVPFLVLVVAATLGVLRLLDRMPSRPLSIYASMGVGLLLCAVAALGLGLLTSATVGNVAQATLALPMLCFPAVLFSGAILPVNLMARAGAALSAVVPSRWAFEAIGHDLGARRILARAARHSGLRCWRPTATPAPNPPAPTGSSSQRSRSCSWSPPGVCSCAAPADRCGERRPASQLQGVHDPPRSPREGLGKVCPAHSRPWTSGHHLRSQILSQVPRKGSHPMNPNKALWEKGDFTRIAESMRESGQALATELGIRNGMKVLDLGCGDGTTALPAARLGADVLGVDIASNLVEAGNNRAKNEGLTNCRFQEGDASNLPDLGDDTFDMVITIFGAMFAPKPLDVAKEMVRVTRPGGRIVMGNWIPGDPTLVAQILEISSSYSPPPPQGFISPMTWGVENNVIERFAAAGVPAEQVSFATDTYRFNFSGTPSEFLALIRTYYGPTMDAFEAAEATGRGADLQNELEVLFNGQNVSPNENATSIPATFLRVTVAL